MKQTMKKELVPFPFTNRKYNKKYYRNRLHIQCWWKCRRTLTFCEHFRIFLKQNYLSTEHRFDLFAKKITIDFRLTIIIIVMVIITIETCMSSFPQLLPHLAGKHFLFLKDFNAVLHCRVLGQLYLTSDFRSSSEFELNDFWLNVNCFWSFFSRTRHIVRGFISMGKVTKSQLNVVLCSWRLKKRRHSNF